VFLTHLHFDHVGGAIMREGDKLVTTFKNAPTGATSSIGMGSLPERTRKGVVLKREYLAHSGKRATAIIPVGDGIQFSKTSL